ncbi:single-stranded DNA-binding protein [Thomasclavelia sp.]
MINRVVLVGRMTRDPELRRTPQGDAVTSFTLAVNRNFTSRDGQQQADFINCVVWRKPAENVERYCSKGSLVGVEGRIQTRSYDNAQGQKVYVVEVICDSVQFLETRAARERTQSQQPQMQMQQSQNNDNFYDMKTVELEKEFDNSLNTYDIMEDDIQF